MTANRTKRILSVQPVCDGGGSEHALISMVRQLTADGWECHVAVPAPARLAPQYAAAGAVLHLVPMRRLTTTGGPGRWLRYTLAWPVSVARLVRLGRRLGAAVVHSNSLHSWYGWAAAAVIRRPHVWHAREIVFQSPLALKVERHLARRWARAVIAVSQAVADQLDPANVVVIIDEADPDRFSPDRAGLFRAAEGVADDAPLVGSVARLDVWKGFDVLLDAFEQVRAHRPDAQLVVAGGAVAGKDGYAAGLQARAGRIAGVRWLGARPDVPEIMADLDVFAQVSTEPEPFGLVVVEALASGVPAIAGAAGGPLEILGDAPPEAGRLVPPGDSHALAAAILQLLPEAGSSVASRRSRHPLRQPETGGFSALFSRIAAAGRQTEAARSR
ncbi:MAG: glycosyltransferase family 4 protein [Acidimicrobiales bacterium]|nr:glycosyltransferase family 4 protein [Acidimicrobiales bacterium]